MGIGGYQMELGHWAERETGSGRLQNKAGEVWQVWPSSTMGGLKSLWLLTQGVCGGRGRMQPRWQVGSHLPTWLCSLSPG